MVGTLSRHSPVLHATFSYLGEMSSPRGFLGYQALRIDSGFESASRGVDLRARRHERDAQILIGGERRVIPSSKRSILDADRAFGSTSSRPRSRG